MSKTLVAPVAAVGEFAPYTVPKEEHVVRLKLDSNEGAIPNIDCLDLLRPLLPGVVREYPSKGVLENALASRLSLAPENVLVTAGGDDALDRICRTVLAPGKELIMPVPSFEMLQRYARFCGAEVSQVLWNSQEFPVEKILEQVSGKTAAIAVVSPNNPTGAVIRAEQFEYLARRVPHLLLLVDFAYIEFADQDLTQLVLSFPNAVIVRTFSKAWGLAGLRVGYVLGCSEIVDWVRRAGNPYPVSALSLAVAQAILSNGQSKQEFIDRVKLERRELEKHLLSLGASVFPSQANFVFCRSPQVKEVYSRLYQAGIATRIFPNSPLLEDAMRISCPGNAAALAFLQAELVKAFSG